MWHPSCLYQKGTLILTCTPTYLPTYSPRSNKTTNTEPQKPHHHLNRRSQSRNRQTFSHDFLPWSTSANSSKDKTKLKAFLSSSFPSSSLFNGKRSDDCFFFLFPPTQATYDFPSSKHKSIHLVSGLSTENNNLCFSCKCKIWSWLMFCAYHDGWMRYLCH